MKFKRLPCALMAVVLALVLVATLASGGAAWLNFKLLQANPDSPHARDRASRLLESRHGIDLCVEDIDMYGGTTKGWSSWILTESSLSTQVESRLDRLIADETVPGYKSIEAAWIMWERTEDIKYLLALFRKAKGPGDRATKAARGMLQTIFDSTVREKFEIPPAQALMMTEKEFRAHAQELRETVSSTE